MKNKNRTIIVDFGCENQYQKIISDGQVFIEYVIAFILSIGFQVAHKCHCSGGSSLTRHSHYTRVKSGGITIWRIQCKTCKAVFTVIPSFLMRYFGCRTKQSQKALLAYHGGLSLENCAISFNISPMSLYRIICAFGKYSTEKVLAHAGISLPEYIQVDEKHTKCLGKKGYIPIISSGHIIWHIDYVNSVEEDTLETSYKKFDVETKKIEPSYTPRAVTHDGFKATTNALGHIFKKATSNLICWLHACWSLVKILEPFSKEEANNISYWLLYILKECHQKVSLRRISLKNRFIALLKRYKEILPANIFENLKSWVNRKKPYLYTSMDFPSTQCFSYSIDHICNHLDRKLFMMKYFHHYSSRKDLFVKGYALIHCFVPYQRFARNAYLSPVQVEGASLPHKDWFISLSILTSGGYKKQNNVIPDS